MNQLGTDITYDQQDSLPRFNDEITRASTHVGSVRLVWKDACTTATIWLARASEIQFCIPLDSPTPGVGQVAEMSARFDSQDFHCVVSVESSAERYGSFKLISCRLCSQKNSPHSDEQRRANTRFTFSSLYPLFCLATNPTDGRVIPLRALDISNGGISLIGPAPINVPFLGLAIACQFDAPTIGCFSATLVLREIDISRGSAPAIRVSAEFQALDARAREVVGLCLTRPNSSNSVRELVRERFLPKSWTSLIDFSSIREIAGNSVNESATVAPSLDMIGRLADELVCRYTLTNDNGLGCSIAGGPTIAELDGEALQRAALAAIIIQARSIGVGDSALEKAIRSPSPGNATPSDGSAFRLHAGRKSFRTEVSNRGRSWRTAQPAGRFRSNVRWDEYAEAYDIMCAANPAYSENLDLFRRWIGGLGLQPEARICDVGAGTGNYVLEIAKCFPMSRITHLDSDPMMNRTASRKYKERGAINVGFATSSASAADFPGSNFDLIVCVNALYTFDSASRTLEKFHSWLKPTGHLFLIDLGRQMNVMDWSRYIIKSSIKAVGVRATASAFIKGRKAIGQNRLIRQEQLRGRFWLHSPSEFAATLHESGFDVVHAQTCYRDVCDLAVCRKA